NLGGVAPEQFHAVDYMVYGYLQEGRDSTARRTVGEGLALTTAITSDALVTNYNRVAMEARVPLERDDWVAAARLPVRAAGKGGIGEALGHFTGGNGDARAARGAPAGARARGRPAARRRSLRRRASGVRVHPPPRAPAIAQPVRRRPGGGARGRSVRRASPVHGVSGTDARGRRRPPGRRDRASRPGSTLTISALALATFLLGLGGGGPPGITWSPHAPLEGSLV